MKKLLAAILVSFAVLTCYSTESKVPTVCTSNLDFCISSYDEYQESWCQERNYSQCSRTDWNNLCLKDLQECRANW